MRKILSILLGVLLTMVVSCAPTPAEIAEQQRTDSIKAEQLAKEKWEKDSLFYTQGILNSLTRHSVFGTPIINKDFTGQSDSLKLIMTCLMPANELDTDLKFDLDLALSYLEMQANDTDVFERTPWIENVVEFSAKEGDSCECLEMRLTINKNLIVCCYCKKINVMLLFEFIGWRDYHVINAEPTATNILKAISS